MRGGTAFVEVFFRIFYFIGVKLRVLAFAMSVIVIIFAKAKTLFAQFQFFFQFVIKPGASIDDFSDRFIHGDQIINR